MTQFIEMIHANLQVLRLGVVGPSTSDTLIVGFSAIVAI